MQLSEISKISPDLLLEIENGMNFDIQYSFSLCQIYGVKSHELFTALDDGSL